MAENRRGFTRAAAKGCLACALACLGAVLWSTSELDTLGGLLFLVHDHFAAQVYPDLPDLSLDVEIELTRDDRIVLKQARPLLGGL